MSPELNSELEKNHIKIAEMLGLDRELLTFSYNQEGDVTTLQLVTMNPRHKQSFLFHETTGFGEMNALNNMVDYIKKNRITQNTYTIQWSLDDKDELHTSYFRGKNIYEVLDKFYFGKDVPGTIIFNISLNPLS